MKIAHETSKGFIYLSKTLFYSCCLLYYEAYSGAYTISINGRGFCISKDEFDRLTKLLEEV